MLKKLRPYLSVLLLSVVLVFGFYYLFSHHSLLKQLGNTPFSVILIVYLLYAVMFFVLALIFWATVKLCSFSVEGGENLLLNGHSMLLNFFIPGQSGPAYRGYQLKTKHGVSVKKFLLATLMYYGTYLLINTGLLFGPSRPWWLTTVAVVLVSIVSFLAIKYYAGKNNLKDKKLLLTPKNLGYLVIACVAQAVLQIIIYGVELHSVNKGIRLSQIVTYTGAANLTLFVALTPGAIGIREFFLLLTRRLHHISSSNIIVASFIDRSVYIVFLLSLAAVLLLISLKNKRKTSLENSDKDVAIQKETKD